MDRGNETPRKLCFPCTYSLGLLDQRLDRPAGYVRLVASALKRPRVVSIIGPRGGAIDPTLIAGGMSANLCAHAAHGIAARSGCLDCRVSSKQERWSPRPEMDEGQEPGRSGSGVRETTDSCPRSTSSFVSRAGRSSTRPRPRCSRLPVQAGGLPPGQDNDPQEAELRPPQGGEGASLSTARRSQPISVARGITSRNTRSFGARRPRPRPARCARRCCSGRARLPGRCRAEAGPLQVRRRVQEGRGPGQEEMSSQPFGVIAPQPYERLRSSGSLRRPDAARLPPDW